MAKIRLIEPDIWHKFRRIADDLKISNNELIRNFINGIAINFTPDEKNLNLETAANIEKWQKQHKDIVAELEKTIENFRTEIKQYDKDLEWRRGQIKELETIETKHEKRLASQKETILKKNETIKEIKAKLSVYRKENKKLFKQVKALTVVEDEEDGDSESAI